MLSKVVPWRKTTVLIRRVPPASIRRNWCRALTVSARKNVAERTKARQFSLASKQKAQLQLRKLKELTSNLALSAHIYVEAIHEFAFSACAKRRQYKAALRILQYIIHQGVEPNVIAYSSVTHACAKSNQVERAFQLLVRMQ